jgi:UDP-N-acetylmuramyl pentapeptide phosphotransferase/UDP-N-acetylglucosamine-1-phosphate transferase
MHSVLFILLVFVLSAGITTMMIPKIILISFKKNLFDTVDERKVHKGVVPRLGGVAFTPAIIISLAVAAGIYSLTYEVTGFNMEFVPMLALCLCALMLLYIEGITDDLIGVGYKVKFACQTICALLIVLSGIWINDLNGLFGVNDIPWYVGMPLTTVLIVYIINAINLIDGIDGLASGLSLVALFFIGCLQSMNGDAVSAVIAFATVGTLIPFFIFNVFGKAEKHKKIFMGDCGSQTIGLILGMLAVKFCMSDLDVVGKQSNTLLIAISVLLIPCLDVIRVMIGRLKKGLNPFLPDMTHIHHKFLALGMSHHTAMLTILMIDAFFIMLNLGMASFYDINISFAISILLWCGMHMWISKMIKKIKEREGKIER